MAFKDMYSSYAAFVTPTTSKRAVAMLFLCSSVTSATLGYDGSMINGLNILPSYSEYFHLTTSTLALQTAISWAGSMVAGFFFGKINESLGRKWSMFICAVALIISAILQTASQNIAMFCVSRFLIGMASSAAYICAPAYLSETLPMKWRGIGLGLFMDFYYVGGILAAGVTYGSFKMSSTWAWRLPSALQGVFSVFSLLFLPLVPESPRWLVHKGRNSEALAVLALTYADGDAEDPVVLTVYKEIIDTLTFEKEREKEISYMAVLRHKPTLKRLSLMLSVAIITMVSGNTIVSYYLGNMLDNAGISDEDTQLQINIYLNIWCLAVALAGTALIERMGRKPLAVISCALMTVLIFVFGALNKVYGASTDNAAVYGSVACIFLFQGAYSFAWTPLAFSYPPEVLNYSIRSMGLAMFAFVNNGFGLMVTMAFPYALDAITWKTYMINGAWDVLQLVFVLVFWVETKGLSLEEIDMLFDGVKHSDVVDVCDAMRGKADPMVLNDIDITMEEPVAVVGKVDKES